MLSLINEPFGYIKLKSELETLKQLMIQNQALKHESNHLTEFIELESKQNPLKILQKLHKIVK